jgi:hypothetical protein
MNEVYDTESFSELCSTLEKEELLWIEKIKDQLKENLNVGKPLQFGWFREKKFGNKRLYYLINEKSNKAIIIAFGTKKEQQKTINYIIFNKERFLKFIS